MPLKMLKIISLILIFFFSLNSQTIGSDQIEELKGLMDQCKLALNYRNHNEVKKHLRKINKIREKKQIINSDIYTFRMIPQIEHYNACLALHEGRLNEARDYINNAIMYQQNNIVFRQKFVEIHTACERSRNPESVLDTFDIYDRQYKSPHWNKRDIYKSLYYYKLNDWENALQYGLEALENEKDDLSRSAYLQAFLKYKMKGNIFRDDEYVYFLDSYRNLRGINIFPALFLRAQSFQHLFLESRSHELYKFIQQEFPYEGDVYAQLISNSKGDDETFELISNALRITPWDERYWDSYLSILTASYNKKENDKYQKRVLQLIKYFQDKIKSEKFFYPEICKGFLSLFNHDIKKAKKHFEKHQNKHINGKYYVDEYLINIYLYLEEYDHALNLLKKRNVGFKDLDLDKFSPNNIELYKEIAFITFKAGSFWSKIFWEKLKKMPGYNSDDFIELQGDINQYLRQKTEENSRKIEEANDAIYQLAANFYAFDQHFQDHEKESAAQFVYLLERVDDLDRRLEANYEELIKRIEKNHTSTLIKIEALRVNLEKQIQSERDERINEQARLLKEVLDNRSDINYLRNELKSRLSDYINVSVGIGLGPVSIGVNVLRVIEDLLEFAG